MVKIVDVIKFHHRISMEFLEEKKGIDYYRVDRSHTHEYLKYFSLWKRKIEKYFKELHAQSVNVVHVDICGRTEAKSLGADKSYCFSLKASANTKSYAPTHQFFYDGNIFDTVDFSKFIRLIKNEKPAFATFVPEAGLRDHRWSSDRNITLFILMKRLCSIIQIMRPGGYIFISKPFDGINMEDASKLKSFVEGLNCNIEIIEELGGPYFLIEKLKSQ